MNNGRPPYGDPSQWGQQPAAGQNPAAPYGQQPQAGYSQQSPYGQQPQAGYPQQPYGQQPYQPQAYQSQPYQPQSYASEMYQPQARQAQESYQQQSWQPYGQDYQQGYAAQPGYPQQGYAQQAYPQQQPYQQGMQNGQPLQQGYPQQTAPGAPQQPVVYNAQPVYSGYVSQPRGKAPVIDAEIIMKVVLCGVLPILFVLGLLFKSQVLCWIFLAGAVAAVAAMWLRELVDEKVRLTATLVYGVLAVVALVTAFNGAPANGDPAQQAGNTGMSGNASQQGSYGTGMTWEATPSPTQVPTPTPDPYQEAGQAAEQLQSFFYFWHVNNDENMLALTAPSWRAQQEKPLEALYQIRANRTPLDNCNIISISGSEADTMRTAKVEVSISKNIINREPQLYSFDVIMLKEDDVWYVDPLSLTSNETVQTTKAQTNEMPTQPVLNTGAPSMVLYYNPDGGSYYHADPNCYKIDKKYLPLKGQFLYSQLNDAPYSELKNCTGCGAPLRQN